MVLLSSVLCQLPLGAQPRIKRAPRTHHDLRLHTQSHDFILPSGYSYPDFTYNGGLVVEHASYWMLYWGDYWTTGLGLQQRNHFNSFIQAVAPSSGFAGQFAAYQQPGSPILAGSFAGEKLISTSPGASIDDTGITAQIGAWIQSGFLPVPDANTVFVNIFPPGTDVTSGGQSACEYFYGYHNDAVSPLGSFGYYRYIVLPYQNCFSDLAADGAVTVNGMTDTLGHEMAETETDPDVSYLTLGWYDNNDQDEIADICADTSATLGYLNFWFQKVWSTPNGAQGTCIGPVSGSPSIHLTISQIAEVYQDGTTEPAGAANILPSFPVTFTVSTDSATPVSLSVTGLPAGVTYTLNPTTVSASSSASLEVSTNASPGPAGVATVTATLNSQQAQFQFLVVPWQQVSAVNANVTNTGFAFNPSLSASASYEDMYSGSITVTNTGSQPIGPTILVGYHSLASGVSYPYTVGAGGTAAGPTDVGPNGDYVVQMPDGMLGSGQSVTQNVAFQDFDHADITFTPQVFQVQAPSACSISQNGPNIVDAQLIVNQALGATLPANDLNSDGSVNVVDVQLVMNAVLGLGCSL